VNVPGRHSLLMPKGSTRGQSANGT
jgi:hypothetical protein